jgi:hypothetical protein
MKKFEVIKDHSGHDNCWNRPSNVDLKAGDILEATDTYASNRGDLFFFINGNRNNCVMPSSVHARHPYDTCVFDLTYLKEIENVL